MPDSGWEDAVAGAPGNVAGFSLHAGVAVKGSQREKLERLCRYICRPPVSEKRLFVIPRGDIGYSLRTPYRDGTTHVIFEPLDFIARLATLVPPPRINLTRFHGVFAPNSPYRARITPARRGAKPTKPAPITLLHQRASIAAGRAVSGEDTLAALAVNLEDDPVYLVAQGEWAAWMGDHDVAERMFNQAVTRAESWAVPNTLAAVADAYARWLLERGRVSEALALAGRIAGWAEYDYDSTLLQVAVFHASGQHEVWATALQRAQELAGERELPAELLSPPE